MYQKGQWSQSKRLTLARAFVSLGMITANSLAFATGNDPCAITKVNDWGSGFRGEAVVTNDTSERIGIWS
ncbi:MAG: hypothetical protein P8171_11050, partial [Candidatus Thiodiazotropha sp.]